MQLVIIEDESLAARRLQKMILSLEPAAQIVATLDSIVGSVAWLRAHPAPDLILMDIELVDGQSFEIFRQIAVQCPVIFTTAYDAYAIQAFKVNSIDYLLKPIQEKELQQSLEKFKRLRALYGSPALAPFDAKALLQEFSLLQPLANNAPRERLLVKQGQRMLPMLTAELSYFFTRDRLVYTCTKDKRHFQVDFTLDELEQSLDGRQFFRANRQFIVSFPAVQQVHAYFNGKLKITLSPAPEEEVIISREKAHEFKAWLGE